MRADKSEEYNYCLKLLKKMIGEDKGFRPGQWEAIEAVAIKKQRVLVVQRTGWGKSMVYFLATKILRRNGAGPTLLISPLLSLMRNQIEMAAKIGLQAHTINSANQDEWNSVIKLLKNNQCDIVLVSPERLNNKYFLEEVLQAISGRIGLFVVDEAHCISDWGHDFRPDYQRIVRIIQMLPRGMPVLGTTATANDRVVVDIKEQLGKELIIQRGSLARESLYLQNIHLAGQSERLAWLAENIKRFKGSGVIYCLTVADTERVASWLDNQGFSTAAYHAGVGGENRKKLEEKFLKNEIKILVATVALGMGFDKPDIEFVIHFQRPSSLIAYYQQVGRAGRALENSYGVLLSGCEDDEIQNYFIESAFPSEKTFEDVLNVLEKRKDATLNEILEEVNITKSMAEKAIKLLEIDGAVGRTADNVTRYFRTLNPWQLNKNRIERVLGLRREEIAEVKAYLDHKGCLQQFILKALNDTNSAPCGCCVNCSGKKFSEEVAEEMIIEAENYLKGYQIIIEPRKQFPGGLFADQKRNILPQYQNAPGRALCSYGDGIWGELVRSGKYKEGRFCEQLVEASANLICKRWKPNPFPTWVTAIPSTRHPTLVPDFAKRLAEALGIPFLPVIQKIRESAEQKTMLNSTMQARNVIDTIEVEQEINTGPVLLVDDIVDSRWTLTIAGYLLRKNGSGIVYPFALAQATTRDIG